MKKTMLLLAVLSAICIGSCKNIGYEKTKTGLEYKIISDGKGKELKKGDYVKFNYKITHGDSVITSSYNFVPGYDEVDSVGRYHDFSELLPMMRVGDSGVCFQLYDSLATRAQGPMPGFMKKGDKLKMTFKILDGITGREAAIADYQKEMENFKDRDLAKIEKYLAANKINAQKVNNTVFVEIQNKGTGIAADSGKMVGIKYNCYNYDGQYFDSNIDSTKQINKHGMEPFYFVAKQQGAVAGILDGITVFNQGGKGRIFVPSLLAYGPQGSPPSIKPNENLIFDIEVVDVKDAPQRQPQFQMPQPQPQEKE
ncbi:FKBP-type peptidyl-prolyl cis-trans isomerase [Pollutibacter soli]|uniref:FKBP-type peptidyl-prolyl cis-trans isomerase n=1 Tax=Pollutibacter soli TaxID=3034157 RepID=UPI003013823B